MNLPLSQDGHAGDRRGDNRHMLTTCVREHSHHASVLTVEKGATKKGQQEEEDKLKIVTRI